MATITIVIDDKKHANFKKKCIDVKKTQTEVFKILIDMFLEDDEEER